MTYYEIMGYIAAAVGAAAYGIYIKGILSGKVKPHLYTWAVWTLVTAIDAAAKYVEKGGPATWVTVAMAVVSLIITILAAKHGDKQRAPSDKFALIFALAAIPVWMIAHEPLYAVIIISMIDTAAFYPTFRKSWYKPHEESASSFALAGLLYALVLMSLETVNLTTVLFPAMVATVNTLLVCMLLSRRKLVTQTA